MGWQNPYREFNANKRPDIYYCVLVKAKSLYLIISWSNAIFNKYSPKAHCISSLAHWVLGSQLSFLQSKITMWNSYLKCRIVKNKYLTPRSPYCCISHSCVMTFHGRRRPAEVLQEPVLINSLLHTKINRLDNLRWCNLHQRDYCQRLLAETLNVKSLERGQTVLVAYFSIMIFYFVIIYYYY